MANCLVTKLKGTVNNPDLLKLGQCMISTDDWVGEEQYTNLFVYYKPTGQPVTITPKSGVVYIAIDIDTANLPEPAVAPTVITDYDHFSVYIPDGGEFFVEDYYNAITGCNIGGLKPEIFNYLTTFEGNLLLSKNCLLSNLNVSLLSRVSGIFDLGGAIFDTNLMTYIEAAVNATGIYCGSYDKPCTAEEFGAAFSTTVTEFVPPRGNVQFSGTIEGFVAAQREKGKTSGSIGWYSGDTANTVTFDGLPIGGPWDSLTWTANTITFLGKTIHA